MLMSAIIANSQEVLTQIEQIETICGRDVGHGIEPLVAAAKGGYWVLLSPSLNIHRPMSLLLPAFLFPTVILRRRKMMDQ